MPFGFTCALVHRDGTPAGTFATAVPNWQLGDRIEAGGNTFRIVDMNAGSAPDSTHGVFVVEAVED